MKRARFLPLLLLLAAAPLRATTWMNFEPSTLFSMMAIDTGAFFKDNFYTLRTDGLQETELIQPTTYTYSGTGALRVGLNYDNRAPTPLNPSYPGSGVPYWGVNDAVFFTMPPYSFLSYTGLAIYVYVAGTPTSGNPAYPLKGKFFVKTGNTYEWYNGETVNIKPNQWTRLRIDFTAAYNASGAGPMAVPNLNLMYDAGVQFVGADYDRGTTTVWLDEVQHEVGGVPDNTSAPSAPGSLSAVPDATAGNLVNLQWPAVSASDLDHYNVYRSPTGSAFSLSTNTFVTAVPAGQTSLPDAAVVDGVPYYYEVAAVDKAGNESAPVGNSATPSDLSAPAAYEFSSKGMSYVGWSTGAYGAANPDGSFDSHDSQSSLDDLMSTGADYVSLIVTQYMDHSYDTVIQASTKTPTDDLTDPSGHGSVERAIDDIHARGMKVLLKPHVDVKDGTWRGDILPSDPAAWFASYQTFIDHYADIAKRKKVEMFCVGTELKTMTDNKKWMSTSRPTAFISDHWKFLINEVRTRLTGADPSILLVYAANAVHPQDEFAQIEFWNSSGTYQGLNYVGLDAWWKLTNVADPSLLALEKAWSMNREGFDPLQSAVDWHAFTGLPVVITELGSRSQDGANIDPTSDLKIPVTDGGLSEQDNIYKAGFAAWNHRKSWVQGLFWWHWDPNPNGGGRHNNYYVPNDKPVLQTITQAYGGESVAGNFHYDFETSIFDYSGSTYAWIVDPSTTVPHYLASPAYSSVGHGASSHSLSYSLATFSPSPVNDYGYIEPAIRKDLSGYKGIKAYVYLPSNVVSNEGTYPLQVSMVLQTGTGYDWCESSTPRNLSWGQWREVSMDFQSAKCIDGVTKKQTYTSIPNTQDIRRIGVKVYGASAGGSPSTLYVDDVVARSTVPATGLSLNTTYFWLVNVKTSSCTATSLDFQNTGNKPFTFWLKTANASPSGWTPSLSSTTFPAESFLLNGVFNNTPISSGQFIPATHALVTEVMAGNPMGVKASSTEFAGNNCGIDGNQCFGTNLQPGDVRHLWLEFRPLSFSGNDAKQSQTITIGVTADTQ
jgi:hypothetical protein